jgi:hypothetical protein
VGVLFRYLDGLFMYGFFMSWDEEDHLPKVHPNILATADRDFAWLDELWRRSLILHGDQRNVAKLFSVSPRLPRFLEAFPQAQILYMARDPLEVIPSSMSLMIGVLDRAFAFWKKPEADRQRWLDRMYRAWIMLFRSFYDDWTSGAIDKKRVYIVRYDRMMADFDGMMEEMCVFLGHEMTPELRADVKKLADKQRAYKSEHKYNLAKFGLDEERIKKDCAFFYDEFLPPLERSDAAQSQTRNKAPAPDDVPETAP